MKYSLTLSIANTRHIERVNNKKELFLIMKYYVALKASPKGRFWKKYNEKRKVNRQITFDGIAPKEGIALDFNFKNENIDLTIDGIEFTGKKKFVPIFITPFEKITMLYKLLSFKLNLIFKLKVAKGRQTLHWRSWKILFKSCFHSIWICDSYIVSKTAYEV